MRKATKTNFVTQQQLTVMKGGRGISHTHPNKDVLDQITEEMLSFWHYDAENKVVYLGDAENPVSLAAFGEVTAGGVGESPSPTPGVFTSIAYAGLSDLTTEEMDKIPTAWAAKKMLERIEALEQGGGGGGNVDDVYVNDESVLGEDKIARIHLTWENIQDAPSIPTALADLEGDETHRLVTDEQISAWTEVAALAHSHENKTALDLIRYDATNNVVYIGDSDNPVNFAAFGEITAGGIGAGGGGAQYLYQLGDIYHSDQTILRADGTQRQPGDAIVYNSAQNKWVAAAVQATGGVTSFNTRTGAVTLSSSDVTTALGFIPYNSSNPAGYITNAALAGYLPLSGGTMTGDVHLLEYTNVSWDIYAYGSQAVNPLTSYSASVTGAPINSCVGYSFTTNYAGFQIASDYSYNNSFWMRGWKDMGGGWKAWQELIHSGNIANKIAGLSCAYATNAGGISAYSPVISAAIERDTVDIIVMSQGSWEGRWGAGNGFNLQKAFRFQWYDTYNYFGLLRGLGTDSAGFGWGYQASPSSAFQPIAQLNINGSLYLRGSGHFKGLTTSGNVTIGDYINLTNNQPTIRRAGVNILRIADAGLVIHPYSGNGFIALRCGDETATSGAKEMRILASGNVGIGTPSPSEKLHVVGNVLATGEITAGSDIRWKHNITPVQGGIDAIMKLNPCEWDWKEGHGNGHSAGLIAQQVAAYLPFAVKGNEDDGYTLNYNVFHAYEISAIQSHETRIQQLERENAELKRMLKLN